jgi:hypothetical protein
MKRAHIGDVLNFDLCDIQKVGQIKNPGIISCILIRCTYDNKRPMGLALSWQEQTGEETWFWNEFTCTQYMDMHGNTFLPWLYFFAIVAFDPLLCPCSTKLSWGHNFFKFKIQIFLGGATSLTKRYHCILLLTTNIDNVLSRSKTIWRVIWYSPILSSRSSSPIWGYAEQSYFRSAARHHSCLPIGKFALSW